MDAEVGDAAFALDVLREISQTTPNYWRVSGKALIALGDADAGMTHLDRALLLDPEDFRVHLDRAEAIKMIGKRRGAQLATEALDLRSSYDAALSIQQGDPRPRFYLVRAHLARREFSTAGRYACPTGPDVEAFIELNQLPDGAPDDWLFALHAALLDQGKFVSAYEVKHFLAKRRASTPPWFGATAATILEWARAHAWLGNWEVAAQVATSVRPWHDKRERLVLMKFVADVDASQGDISTLASFAESNLVAFDTVTEHRFASRIAGCRVAVVGPAPVDLDFDLSEFDTVITTKQLVPFSRWHRGVVSYYSDANAMLDRDVIAGLIDAGAVDLVVVRPTLLAGVKTPGAMPFRCRVMPTEDLSTYYASRFSIQRIVYDVLRYSPASLHLLGVDLFAGDVLYQPGYDTEVDRIFDPMGYEKALSLSVHDYLDDYRYIQRLTQAGLVSVTPQLAELLSLGGSAYLQRLERGPRR
jgi:hypothetical protein